MNTAKIQIAQVGVKNHGGTILHATKEAGNLELISVFDTDTAAAENIARECNILPAQSYQEILSDPRVKAISLVTPNHLHAEEVKQAAKAGKHVFVEKPLSMTVAEGRGMIEAMRKVSRVLMVGHNTRRRRVFRRVKQLLSENAIGKIASVEMNLSRPAGLQPGLPEWKSDPEKCPLLPMTQLGIHFIDTIEYLLGPIQRVSCFAAARAMGANILDASSALLQLSSGIPATLTSSYITPDVYFIQIYGTEGIIRCNSLSLSLELSKPGEIPDIIEENFEGEGAESYILEMREFGDCILSGKQPETGGLEGLRAVAAVEAMIKSIRTKSVIEISETL